MPQLAKAESTETQTTNTPAPYLAFLTFLGAIEALEHGIPKKLDRTMWPSQSGLVQSQILMAFRFLGLVDEQDRPTPILHTLVEDKDNRTGILTTVLNESYTELIDHDLTKMTPKTLEEEMERYSVSGDTKRKAVTFFLRAAKFVGMPVHPLLSSMVRNSGPRKRRAKRLVIADSQAGAEILADGVKSTGSTKTVRLSNGGTVTLTISSDPFTLPSEDRKFVFDLVDTLQGYASAHPVSEEEDEEDDE